MGSKATRAAGDVRPPPAFQAWKRSSGVGISMSDDVASWRTGVDELGRPLQGLRKYVLRFNQGQHPPALGFWSLAMYNQLYLPVDNPIRRFAIGDRDQLSFGSDGSLEICIQHAKPGAGANWLPAPKGSFVLALSIYWPAAQELLEWQPPGLRCRL
jgi:hypothetical protein